MSEMSSPILLGVCCTCGYAIYKGVTHFCPTAPINLIGTGTAMTPPEPTIPLTFDESATVKLLRSQLAECQREREEARALAEERGGWLVNSETRVDMANQRAESAERKCSGKLVKRSPTVEDNKGTTSAVTRCVYCGARSWSVHWTEGKHTHDCQWVAARALLKGE